MARPQPAFADDNFAAGKDAGLDHAVQGPAANP
jgi:hypothetical protein